MNAVFVMEGHLVLCTLLSIIITKQKTTTMPACLPVPIPYLSTNPNKSTIERTPPCRLHSSQYWRAECASVCMCMYVIYICLICSHMFYMLHREFTLRYMFTNMQLRTRIDTVTTYEVGHRYIHVFSICTYSDAR